MAAGAELTIRVGLMAGEQAAFDAFVERHSRFVFRVAYAVLRHAADADDATQETFLRVFRGGAWRRMDDEHAFLARTAWRVAVSRRSRRRHDELDPETASHAINPEQAAIAGDWGTIVHRLIDALPDELRIPLVLSAIDEMNSRAIAAAMDIPEGTVRTRLMRARQILKDKLHALREARHA